MSDFLDRISKLSPERLMLLAADLQGRLEKAKEQPGGPLAVVGMDCRFPGGANSPDAYWKLLKDGVDAIKEVPPERWDIDAYFDADPDAPGKMVSRWGGFIDDVDRFDAEFFRISPREATSMDPQQRLLLQVAWHALEDAGIAPDSLAGSRTGVFVGLCSSDYFQLQLRRGAAAADTYLATGGADSVASGRLSYFLGLQGPAVSVDTACSSSLTAVHLASQALRSGECDMALAAGVNTILWPESTMTMSRGRMLAPDGRCKTFDARADGFVRGEGCGVVILKRLVDAEKQGDRILAVIRGSAVNQDGRSNGLTAPNGQSQEALIRAALADADLRPSDVSYVETHGTGTPLGDRIEVHSLNAALSDGRGATSPVTIGSVKTNFGHLEAAAGMAGLIKVILAIRNRSIPAHLHFEEPSPHLDWDAYLVRVATALEPWNPGSGSRIAGVSSFGFSGSNAHVILEEAPESAPSEREDVRPVQLLPISARSPDVLRELSSKLASHLESRSDLALTDVCGTLANGRAHHAERLAMVVDTMDTTREGLALFGSGQELEPGMFAGSVGKEGPPKIAFLFTGQGSQYVNMGRSLFDTAPVFRESIQRSEALLAPYMDRPLTKLIFSDDPSPPTFNRTMHSQPAVFALEVALAELWRSWGIEPTVVMGHSAGEYAAACVAGVLSLEDGIRFIAERARLVETLPPGGAMAAILADHSRVEERVADATGRLAISAVNGPEHIVISGEKDAVEDVLRRFEAEGVDVRRLTVDHASHSPLMEPILDELEAAAHGCTLSIPKIEFVSTLTGAAVTDEIRDPGYWSRHAREPVQFSRAIEEVRDLGVTAFLEVGPHTTMVGMGAACLPDRGERWLASLRQGRAEWEQILGSLAGLYTAGCDVRWRELDAPHRHLRLGLPTYPFKRDRYWMEDEPASSMVSTLQGSSTAHPLLGGSLDTARGQLIFQTEISVDRFPTLRDHVVYGSVLLPASAYIETILAALSETHDSTVIGIEDFMIHQPLVLAEDTPATVQVIADRSADHLVEVFARANSDESWVLHATGTALTDESMTASLPADDSELARARCQETFGGAEYYDSLRELGVDFGPAFQRITALSRADGEALASIESPDASTEQESPYTHHLTMLDACFQAVGASLPGGGAHVEGAEMRLMVGLERIRYFGAFGPSVECHARIRNPGDSVGEILIGDARVIAPGGRLVAEIEGLRLQRAPRSALVTRHAARPDSWLHEFRWVGIDEGAPTDDPTAYVSPVELARRLESFADELAEKPEIERYGALTAELEDLALRFVVAALQPPGQDPSEGDLLTVENAFGDAGVHDRHRRLVQRLLAILDENGILAREETGWRVTGASTPRDGMNRAVEIQRAYPEFSGELDLLVTCGSRLSEVLCGEQDPLQLLFPGGSTESVQRLTEHSPVAHAYNELVARLVAEAATELPNGRALRVLEVGAGTGGTTAAVVDALGKGVDEYHFTDVSPLFLARAEEKFRDRPCMRFGLLDIEKDPLPQGYEPHSFDLVLAANVVHATRSVRESLGNLRRLLSPGGLLVLLEGSSPQSWVDLTFGLTEGWWRFTDTEQRESHPLLGPNAWSRVLAEGGFEEVVVLPGADARSRIGSCGQSIMIARRSSAPSDASLTESDAFEEAGNWLLVGRGAGVGEALAEHLEGLGQHCVSIDSDRPGELLADSLASVLTASSDLPWRGVVHLVSLDAATSVDSPSSEVAEAVHRGCRTALDLIHALANSELSEMPRLFLVTRGAQGVESSDCVDPSQAAIWGLGRTVATEHPEFWGGLVDLDSHAGDSDVGHIVAELRRVDDEDQVAYRNGLRSVPRLVRTEALPPEKPPRFDSESTYLITGATGGIGLEVVKWAVELGARNLTLVARRAPSESAAAELERLKVDSGATLSVHAADVSNSEDMIRVMSEIDASPLPLRGVFHVAGIFEDRVLAGMDWGRFERVLAPKVSGGWNLHTLTKDRDLDFFVLFSSGASFLAPVGLGNYSAANAFLDGLAEHRRYLGLPVASVNWGPWARTGMAEAVGLQREDQWTEAGFGSMPIEGALEVLGRVVGENGRRSVTRLAVLPVNWSQHFSALGHTPPMFRGLGSEERLSLASSQPALGKAVSLSERLEGMPADGHWDFLLTWVRDEVRRVLGFRSARDLDPDKGFFDLGMDSLLAVELKNRLQAAVGKAVSSTLVFDHPTVTGLAEYLAEDLGIAPLDESTDDQDGDSQKGDQAKVEMDSMSEDELAAMLAQKLKELE